MKTIRNTSTEIKRQQSGIMARRYPAIAVICLLIVSTIFVGEKSSGQGIGISETAITPHASAILELSHTTGTFKGFLPPRMTTAERNGIASPAVGLIVYNTSTNKLCIYDGTFWVNLFSGNSGVNSITGTANRISTGGTEDVIIDIAGTYEGQTSINTIGTIGTGTWNGTAIELLYGGTGAITAAGARTNLGLGTLATQNGTFSGTSSGTNTGDNAVNTSSITYADSKVADVINNGTTTIAPSQNAVFDALALKAGVSQTFYLGTTEIAIDRASAAQSLTGITSIDGNASTATTATNLAGGSLGRIPYQSAANTTLFSAVGTAGQVLQSNGAAAPTWVSPNAGSVTSVSVVSANGLSGTVANPTTTPAITLTTSVTGILEGNGTAISAATSGTDYSAGTSGLATGIIKSTTGTGALTIAVPGDFPTLNQNTTGTASNVTGTVAIANGGTGQTTTQSAMNSLAGGVTSGQYLRGNGTNVQMSSIQVGDVPTLNQNTTGNASTATTATNLAGGSLGRIPYQSAANTTLFSAVGTAGQVLQSNGAAAPTWVSPNAGSVTSVSVVSANGLAGTVANPTTTPAITLTTSVTGILEGNGTAISAATSGTDYSAGTSGLATGIIKSTTGTGALTIAVPGDFPTLNQNTTGTASNVTGTVGLANGGTGQTTTQSAMNSLAGGVTSGQYLRGNGTNVQMSSIQVGDVPTLNQNTTGNASTATTATNLAGGSLGRIPYQSAANTTLFSAVGTAGQVLQSNGAAAPTWATPNEGSVTSVSVVSANGLSGTVATPTTTPAITLTTSVTGILEGNGTAISAATSGTDYSAGTSGLATGILKSTTGTGALTIAVPGDFPTLNQNTTGTASNVTGTVAIANGGTNSSTALSGSSIMISNGTSIIQGSFGTATTVLHGNAAGVPTYSAVGLTTDVSGTLPVGNGGTGTTTLTNHGVLIGSGTGAITPTATGSALQVLQSGGAGADPSFSTATYPATTSINQLLYSSAANAISGLATANNGVLVTGAGGAPSIGSTLPSTVQGNITSLGTITSGVWNSSTRIGLAYGGTNTDLSSGAAVGDILIANTATSFARLADAAVGNALISGGAGVAPSWGKIGLGTHVSGTLPVANGGTGSASKNFVDLTTIQSVAGVKTFTSGLNALSGDVNINVSSDNDTYINTGTSNGTVTVGASSAVAGQTVNIGTGTGVTTVNIATGNTGSKVTIGDNGTQFSSIIFGSGTTALMVVAPRSNTVQTYTVTGAAVGAAVIVNPAAPITTSGIFMNYARVSAPNTVEVGWNNPQNFNQNLSAGQTLNIMVINE